LVISTSDDWSTMRQNRESLSSKLRAPSMSPLSTNDLASSSNSRCPAIGAA
jgi:hypothetical protein